MKEDMQKIRELLTYFDYNSANLTIEQSKVIDQISDIAHKKEYDEASLNG